MQQKATTRREVLDGAMTAAAATTLLGGSAFPAVADGEVGATGTTPEGVKYTVVKKGRGTISPKNGNLVVIRFKGNVKKTGNKIDDIMDNAEGYYYRVGREILIPGISSALRLMHSGDVWDLDIPGNQAFGEAGQAPKPGVPRIPPNADVLYRLEFYIFPGKEEDLIADDYAGKGKDA